MHACYWFSRDPGYWKSYENLHLKVMQPGELTVESLEGFSNRGLVANQAKVFHISGYSTQDKVPGAERERVPGGERAGRPRVPDDGAGRRDGLRDRGEHDLRDGGGGPEDVLPVLDADGGRRQGGGHLPRVRGERLRRGAHGGQHRLGGGRQDEGAVPAGRGLCGERHGGVGGERRVVRGAEPGGRDAQAGGRGGVLRGGEHEHAERGQGVPPVLQVHERGLERVPGAGAESEALRGRERREPEQRERVRGEPAEGLLPGRRERRERLLDAGQGTSGAERTSWACWRARRWTRSRA